MKHFNFILLLFMVGLCTGCVKDEIEDPARDAGREYFPLEVGKYITYAVDSIVFDDQQGGNKKDTVHFELREQVFDFQVNNGDTTYYIERSRRNTPFASWQLTDVWTARRTLSEALKSEENLTFRKMSFPLKDRK